MRLEEALYAHLVSAANTSPLVSTRVYPLLIPQDVALPAIAYQRVGSRPMLAHDGPSGLTMAILQITCQSPNYSATKALAAAVRKDLDGYAGLMGGGSGVTIEYCNQVNELDTDELFDAAITRVDFNILYMEQ